MSTEYCYTTTMTMSIIYLGSKMGFVGHFFPELQKPFQLILLLTCCLTTCNNFINENKHYLFTSVF